MHKLRKNTRIIRLSKQKLDCEAWVYYSDKCKDRTIYIPNRLKYWAGLEDQAIEVMTSIISHESLHLAITDLCEENASKQLDNLFGQGDQHRDEYNGLCDFERKFKPRTDRIKWR